MNESESNAHTPAEKQKERPSFEEMRAIYQDWFQNDKSGTQAALFKLHGWSRLNFFDEASRRGVDA